MRRLAQAWRRRPVLLGLFALASLLAALFAVRSVVFMIYWADPAHRDRPIEGWMTPRYVVQSWGLPPEIVTEALGDGPMPGKRRTIEDLAADRGISVEELVARITAATQSYRANQP